MWRKLIPYFIQGISVGLIGGIVLVYLQNGQFFQGHPVVEIKQVTPGQGPSDAPRENATPLSYAHAVEEAAPAVVNIFTTKLVKRRPSFLDDPGQHRFFRDGPRGREQLQRQSSLGSGVIVSSDGFILTNNHVIEGSDEILVALSDDRNAPAAVVGSDPESDIAVLKINLKDLQSIVFEKSDTMRVGDVVLAIGNPFGVGQTVTQGIISAQNRSRLGISTFENYIQTDAAINPGNSGGALVNGNGELIGINTAIFSRSGGSQGIGFAVPVSLAKDVMAQIIETGHAVRGWLGVEIQTLSPTLAETFGVSVRAGALIAGTMVDGPAAMAGLQAGDIITRIGKKAVHDPRDVLNQIAATPPGRAVQIEVIRAGRQSVHQVTVGSRPTLGDSGP